MTIKAKALVAPWKVTNANRDQTELDENKQEHTSIIKLHEHHEYHLVPDIHNKPSQNKKQLKNLKTLTNKKINTQIHK